MPQPRTKSDRSPAAGTNHLVPADPSLVAAWRKEATARAEARETPFKLDLPSGKAVYVVRMSLRLLLNKGMVPDVLTPQVSETIALIESGDPDKGQREVMDEFARDPVDAYLRWLNLLNFVWLATVVSPKFAKEGEDDPANDVFSLDLVDYDDKLYVYQWTQGVDQSVQDFRLQQAAAVGTLGNGDEVRGTSEQLLRVERTGGRLVGLLDRPSGLSVGDVGRREDRGDQEGPGQEAEGDLGRGAALQPRPNPPVHLGTTSRSDDERARRIRRPASDPGGPESPRD